MKKLFGILLSLSLICAMGTSLVGCKTEDKKAVDKDKKEVKIKEIAAKELKAKGETTVTVEITEDALADMTVTAKADKISGSGKIEKGKKSVDVMVKTEEGAKDGDVAVSIAATDKTKAADTKFKATIK